MIRTARRAAAAVALIMSAGFATDAAAQGRRTSDSATVAHAIERIEQRGGWVAREKDGTIIEASLERTWATDNDIDFIVELKTIRKLDCRFPCHRSRHQDAAGASAHRKPHAGHYRVS